MIRRGILGRIIDSAAERLSRHPDVPAANRDAFRATAVSVLEHEVCSILGYDEVRLRGWVFIPSERRARRERIIASLKAGESPSTIAARERVSLRWVQRLRTSPP